MGSRIICNNLPTEKKKVYSVVLPEMKTTMMDGVRLLALILTFTIAECGPSQEKRQEEPSDDTIVCINCYGGGSQGDAPGDAPSGGPGDAPSGVPGDAPSGAPGDGPSGAPGDGPSGGPHGPDDDNNGSDDDNGSSSGAAVAVAGATIFSTLLVAVASAMN